MPQEYTPYVYYVPPIGLGVNVYPSALAIGGRAAGTVLPATPGKVQQVAILRPLPERFTDMTPDSTAELKTDRDVYEYCDLRIGENLYIPFWKHYGMSDQDALCELFRGYFNGKKAEARDREALQESEKRPGQETRRHRPRRSCGSDRAEEIR